MVAVSWFKAAVILQEHSVQTVMSLQVVSVSLAILTRVTAVEPLEDHSNDVT